MNWVHYKTLAKRFISHIIIVAIASFGFTSCGNDDNKDGNNEQFGGGNEDLVGYWVRESHLNSPARNGSSGTVISYGYQFLNNGVVYEFQMQHTGLSSRYSYAEANVSWEVLTERNGVRFYMNPDKKSKSYTRADKEVYIYASSSSIIMKILGAGRMEATSADGWTEGTYVKIK